MELDISNIRRIIQKSIEDVNNINLNGRIPNNPELIKTQTDQTALLKSIQSAIRKSLTNMSKIKLGTPPKEVPLITQEQIQELKQSAADKNLRAIEEKVAQTQIAAAFEIKRAAEIGASAETVNKLKETNVQIQKANEELYAAKLRSRIDTLTPEQKSAAEQEAYSKAAELEKLLQELQSALKQAQSENSVKTAAQSAALKSISSSTGTIDVAKIIEMFNTENSYNLQKIFENDDLLNTLNELLGSQASAKGGLITYEGDNPELQNLLKSTVFNNPGNIAGRSIVAEYLKMLLFQNERSKKTSINRGFVEGIVQYSDFPRDAAGNNLLAKCNMLSAMSESFISMLFDKFKKTKQNADAKGLNDIERTVAVLAAESSPAFEDHEKLFSKEPEDTKTPAALQARLMALQAKKNADATKQSLAALKPSNSTVAHDIDEVLNGNGILDVSKVDKLLKGHEDEATLAAAKEESLFDNDTYNELLRIENGKLDQLQTDIQRLDPNAGLEDNVSGLTNDGKNNKGTSIIAAALLPGNVVPIPAENNNKKIQAFKAAAYSLTGNNSQDGQIEQLSTSNPTEFVNSDPDGLVKLLQSEKSVNGDASMTVKRFQPILEGTQDHAQGIKIAAKLLQSVINVKLEADGSPETGLKSPEIRYENIADILLEPKDDLYNLVVELISTDTLDDRITDIYNNGNFNVNLINNMNAEFNYLVLFLKNKKQYDKFRTSDLLSELKIISDAVYNKNRDNPKDYLINQFSIVLYTVFFELYKN